MTDPTPPTAHAFSTRTLDGGALALADHAGKLLLLVNTASRCGYTPQYQGLEALWKTLGPKGLVVIGFPCNQFGAQEPGSATEIAAFCEKNYSVTFPLSEKIDVNGAAAHPLWQWLVANAPGPEQGKPIGWNFAKFLVGKDGRIVERFGPGATPESFAPKIEALL
jgi:glutathione peroxidase